MKKIEIDLKYNYVSSKPSSVSWFDLYVNFFVSVVLVGAGRAPAGRKGSFLNFGFRERG